MTELQVLKRRISGFRTAFNNKKKAADKLIAGVNGPPINRAPIVISQLKAYLKELQGHYKQLCDVLSAILDIVIKEENQEPFNHYTTYLETVSQIYEDTRESLTFTLALVESPITPKGKADSEDDSDSDAAGSAAGGSRRARSPPPKSATDIKPEKLKKDFLAPQYASWLRRLNVWFETSRFSKLSLRCQHEYVRSAVSENLMKLIEPDIGEDTPVFPLEEYPDVVAITDLLETEIICRNSLMSRRYSFFQSTMPRTSTFSQYLANLRDTANYCNLSELDQNGIIIFHAITTMQPDYEDLLDDILKLDPSKLDLKKLINMARTFETSQATKKSFRKSAETNRTDLGRSNYTSSRRGRGGARGGGRGNRRPNEARNDDGQARKKFEEKLKAEKRCTKCSELLSTEGHTIPCIVLTRNLKCSLCNGSHLRAACHRKNNDFSQQRQQQQQQQQQQYSKKRPPPSAYRRNKQNISRQTQLQDESSSAAENDASSGSERDGSASSRHQHGATSAVSFCTRVVHRTSWSKDSSLASLPFCPATEMSSAAQCNFVDARGGAWLGPQAPNASRGSIPTPLLKLEFFQNGGNHNVPWHCRIIPDTGSTISLWNIKSVKKYNLKFDNSATAKNHDLIAANGERMYVHGTIAVQARYKDITVHINCLVVDDIGTNAFLSWHDLHALGIISLPCTAQCAACTTSKQAKDARKVASMKFDPSKISPSLGSRLPTPLATTVDNSSAQQATRTRPKVRPPLCTANDCNPPKPQQSIASKKVRQNLKVPKICYVANDSIEKIKTDFSDVLGRNISKKPMPGPAVDIHFKKGINIVPTKVTHAIRTPLHLREPSDEFMANLLENDIVERVSPYDPPPEWILSGFYVRRGKNKARLVVNCGGLNSVIVRPVVPFLSANEVLTLIPAWARFFCYLDALSAYFTVALTAAASRIFTFITDQGRFRAKRGVQGCNVTNDEYLARINEGFRDCRDLLILIDDLLIWSDTKDGLYVNIRNCLLRCREMNLVMGIEKMRIIGPGESLLFGGHLVSSRGFFPDTRRITAITDYPSPECATDVKAWLGLAQTLGTYIENLSDYTEGVRVLLKKGVSFTWGTEQQESFADTKKILTSDLVRKPFNPNLPPECTHLYVDASRKGLGAALMQVCPKTNKMHLITCASRSLAPAEHSYSIVELELSSLVFGILRHKYYLLAHPPYFSAFSDHRPLVGLLRRELAEIQNARLLRLREKLIPYSFRLEHISGAANKISDALSRAPVETPQPGDPDISEIANCRAVYSDPLLDKFRDATKNDKNYQLILSALQQSKLLENLPQWHPARDFKNYWHSLGIQDGLITYDNSRLVVPKLLQPEIIQKCHSLHGGIEKTRNLARSRYFWPKMNRELEIEVQNCTKCQPYLPSQPKEPLIPMLATAQMQILDTDMFEAHGNDYIMACDRYSGYGWAKRIRNKSQDTVIDFLTPIFDQFGYSNICFSDSSGSYLGERLVHFLKSNGVIPLHPSARHPSSNPAEPGVRNIKRLAQKTSTEKEFLSALAKFRRCPRSDGYSPAFMLLSYEPRDPDLPCLPQNELTLTPGLQQRLLTKIKRSEKSNNRRELSKLEIGTKVLIQNPETCLWNETGTIHSCKDDFERSYLVKRHGRNKLITRNRIYLRPLDELDVKPVKKSEFAPNLHELSNLSNEFSRVPCKATVNGGGEPHMLPDKKVRQSDRLRIKMLRRSEQKTPI